MPSNAASFLWETQRCYFIGKKTPKPNCKWSKSNLPILGYSYVVVGWANPSEKYANVKLDHFPKWGKNKKYFKPLDKNPPKTSKKPSENLPKNEALEYDFPSFYPFLRG